MFWKSLFWRFMARWGYNLRIHIGLLSGYTVRVRYRNQAYIFSLPYRLRANHCIILRRGKNGHQSQKRYDLNHLAPASKLTVSDTQLVGQQEVILGIVGSSNSSFFLHFNGKDWKPMRLPAFIRVLSVEEKETTIILNSGTQVTLNDLELQMVMEALAVDSENALVKIGLEVTALYRDMRRHGKGCQSPASCTCKGPNIQRMVSRLLSLEEEISKQALKARLRE